MDLIFLMIYLIILLIIGGLVIISVLIAAGYCLHVALKKIGII